MICRLSDLRYVKVNQGFLEMTGYRREDILGRSTYEIDLFKGAERRHLAIERLASGETIPQMEAQLDLPSSASKWVIVAGQPIEVGDEPCMLFTFADLEPQKKAETALRHSEEQFEKAFRVSPAPTALVKLAETRGFPGVIRVVDAIHNRYFGKVERHPVQAGPVTANRLVLDRRWWCGFYTHREPATAPRIWQYEQVHRRAKARPSLSETSKQKRGLDA